MRKNMDNYINVSAKDSTEDNNRLPTNIAASIQK